MEAPLPVDKTPLPLDKAPLPVDKTPLPVDKMPLAVDKTPLPADKAPLPADKAPLPADKAPLLVDKAPLPANKSPLPVDKAPLPADKAPLPAAVCWIQIPHYICITYIKKTMLMEDYCIYFQDSIFWLTQMFGMMNIRDTCRLIVDHFKASFIRIYSGTSLIEVACLN